MVDVGASCGRCVGRPKGGLFKERFLTVGRRSMAGLCDLLRQIAGGIRAEAEQQALTSVSTSDFPSDGVRNVVLAAGRELLSQGSGTSAIERL